METRETAMGQIRLDKFIADQGVASRKEIKQMIRDGRVTVNGLSVEKPEQKLNPEADCVRLDGTVLGYAEFRYYMMDKPAGILTAARDSSQKTVMDLVAPEMRRMGLFPVGRLDKDTTGLLLLTTDGEFAHRVISPNHDVDKVYLARTEENPGKDAEARFACGMMLGDGTVCKPAKLEVLEDRLCRVTVSEGKYHQVKRMLASVGAPVIELRRLSIGGLKLDESLGRGNTRELKQEEAMLVFQL